jgi:hypothetical protein
MIVSQLPPSRSRGSVAASVHTASFNCFVSTVKGLFFARRWQTLIVQGDPGVDKDCKAFARLFYQRGLEEIIFHQTHDILVAMLNDLGDSGMTLRDAIGSLLMDEPVCELFRRGIIELVWA